MKSLRKQLEKLSADDAAKRLLGSTLIRTLDGKDHRYRIVETESYDQHDQASHSFRRTPRSAIMYGPAGRAYVYFIYGMYFCFNVVCGADNFGAAVLIRAVEPIDEDLAQDPKIYNGPGKLARALNIDKSLLNHDLSKPTLKLQLESPVKAYRIVTTTRIGIKHNTGHQRRFYIKDNPYVSKR